MKTRLGRRFVHNPETRESFWRFPQDVLKGVVELDRSEREKKESRERGEEEEEGIQEAQHPGVSDWGGRKSLPTPSQRQVEPPVESDADEEDISDEYEEVEVTEDEEEGEDQHVKRARTEGEGDQPLEFTEDDIEYQLALMGEEYGLDPEEYGERGEEDWEEGAEGLPLTEDDATALFRDLLDDYHVNPFNTWENIIEEGRIIDDSRYTAFETQKARREAWSAWSRDRIQEVKERKESQEKGDPRIKYLAFLQEHATPKLYWPEFRRKYRKEPEMKDIHLSDRDREKYYRDYIFRLKLPESTRKANLSALLKTIPLEALNRSSNTAALPPQLITDIGYISLPVKVRDPLIEAYISTLPPAPEREDEPEVLYRKRADRQKREKALAERERRVQQEKITRQSDLLRSKSLLKEGEAELEEAMKVGKEGLRSHILEADERLP